jgi:hypothetical protein
MYKYSFREVENLLINYKKVKSFNYSRFDQNNADLLLDIERALTSKHLNENHLSVLYCLYNLELNYIETAIFLQLDLLEVNSFKKDALELLLAVLNGYRTKYRKQYKKAPVSLLLSLDDIKNGSLFIFFPINKNLQLDLLNFLVLQGDTLAKNTLEYLLTGEIKIKEEIIENSDNLDDEEYPYYFLKEGVKYDYFAKNDANNKVMYLRKSSLINLTLNKLPAKKNNTTNKDI